MAAGQEERLLWGEKRAPEVRERRTALPTRFPSGSDVPDPMRPSPGSRRCCRLLSAQHCAGTLGDRAVFVVFRDTEQTGMLFLLLLLLRGSVPP